ncbi:PREDICTED: four and a half LIM domains protein 2-like, partial [Rhagoletis zephyria]|uniref:four and a half LIM domains protein 2-like n=1 Tax=Rhagoletis zephyria TaxID=28612 RepID=UPI0008112643
QIFCERHYLEKIRPRCAACDELIFAPEYLRELSQNWHMDHFVCTACSAPLAGTKYVLHEDRPHCVTCFEQQHSNVCDECQKPIGINCKDLSYKERHWHESCFVCRECKKSLLQQPFGSKHEQIYCGDCYDNLFGTRCDACSEVFKPGQRKLEYKGKQWHETCFLCSKCLVPIGTKSFVPKGEEIYCSECYEVKFATRCVKCCEVIIENGVMFKDEPWHKTCFTCNECKIELAGTSFLVRDEKAYCRECFGEKFSHKCTVCTKPIIGQQTTRFISFEELYWHTECFVCVDCKTRLEGRGFIRDGPDIICGDCAKIKLSAEIEA